MWQIEFNIRVPVLFNLSNAFRKSDKIVDKPYLFNTFPQLV